MAQFNVELISQPQFIFDKSIKSANERLISNQSIDYKATFYAPIAYNLIIIPCLNDALNSFYKILTNKN